jgi:CspA family cold shock protein
MATRDRWQRYGSASSPPVSANVSQGRVVEWDDDEGWGVLDSADTPGGCWAHYSVIEMSGFHTLGLGDVVRVRFEDVEQDGYEFRATWVQPPE